MSCLVSCLLLLGIWLPADTAAASDPPEYRGVFVSTWNPRVLAGKQAETLVSAMQANYFNTLIVQVRKAGDALYETELAPMAYQQSVWSKDLLNQLLKLAHPPDKPARINLYAWFDVLRVRKGGMPTGACSPPHVADASPQWLCMDAQGATECVSQVWLDPGHPEVPPYLETLVTDLASRYEIDGLYLDNLRYPERDWGYNPAAVAQFKRDTGAPGNPSPEDESWCAWRREQLGQLLGKLGAALKKSQPKARLLVSGETWGDIPGHDFHKSEPYLQALQDWPNWLQQGLADGVCLTLHRRAADPQEQVEFDHWLGDCAKIPGGGPVLVSLGAELNPWRDTVLQWQACRKAGVAGSAYFHYFTPNLERMPPWKSLEKYGLLLFSGHAELPPTPGRRRD